MAGIHPVAKEAKMNKAEKREPMAGHAAPAKASGPGPETKPDMAGAMNGNPTDKNPLHGAVKELGAQHPHSYADHGPHHGTTDHIRHMPLHGMSPSKYGR